MRKISFTQIATFLVLLTIIFAAAIASTIIVTDKSWMGDFYALGYILVLFILIYIYAFLVYRVFLQVIPFEEGELEPGSRGEFVAQVNTLFYLILFNTLIRTDFLPIPLKTLVYVCLGAKFGANSFCPGTILDPPLTEVGNNTIIGHQATLYSHAIEGNRFSYYRVCLGSNVTVGAHAILMPGVSVGDGAIVSAGAVVTKGTVIGANEHWGGVPAKLIGSVSKGIA